MGAAAKSWTFDAYSQEPAACDFAFTYTHKIFDGGVLIDPPAWLTLDSASRTFTVQTTDEANADTYIVHVVAEIDDNDLSRNEAHDFTLVVKNDCPTDVITLVTPISATPLTYYISDPKVTFTAVFSQSIATCPITYSLSVDGAAYNPTVDTFITDFDSTTGIFKVYTADFTTYDLEQKSIVVTCTSDRSLIDPDTDTLVLDLKDECWDATLTAPTFAQYAWSWDLWADQSMPFTAMSDDSHPDDTCGSYSYQIVGDYAAFSYTV